MRSEDIAAYVAGLEAALNRADKVLSTRPDCFALDHEGRIANLTAEVERQRTRADHNAKAVNANADMIVELRRQVERLRAALPVLPDVGPVTRDPDGDYCLDGIIYRPDGADAFRLTAARLLAVAAKIDAEATDTTPDTSRVTFGARHEGTGMVLLQHADTPGILWGSLAREVPEWHRAQTFHGTAHAALAKVREHLNAAEARKPAVSVSGGSGIVVCYSERATPDDPSLPANLRAYRYLAREVQALVDQGLRGDELESCVPYRLRDHRAPVTPEPEGCPCAVDLRGNIEMVHPDCVTHRAPVEAADTSSDDEVDELAKVLQKADDDEESFSLGWDESDHEAYRRLARAVVAHRAARTSDGGAV